MFRPPEVEKRDLISEGKPAAKANGDGTKLSPAAAWPFPKGDNGAGEVFNPYA